MRELPILMTGPMVRAVLEGRKTVTRRIVKPQPAWGSHESGTSSTYCAEWKGRLLGTEGARDWFLAQCPYGQPGDRLWVRENFAVVGYGGFGQPTKDGYERFETFGIEFAAGGEPVECHFLNGKPVEGTPNSINYEMAARMANSGNPEGSRPSIHMPRWASRITLEVTGVRVERLQEGEGEIDRSSRYLAEGINRIHHGDGAYYYSAFHNEPDPKNWSDPFDAWRELWQSTGGDWDANPWVWAIEFRRIKQERKAA